MALANNSVTNPTPAKTYRGRLAPSPTGYLHLGHARTFWVAQERARQAGGKLVLRNEDLDEVRARAEFFQAMLEDLQWFGLTWDEGPDIGGPFGPYSQSERGKLYWEAFQKLRASGLVFPCRCSRKDVLQALHAPHAGEEEPVYPGTCRNVSSDDTLSGQSSPRPPSPELRRTSRTGRGEVNWRFRVPDGEVIEFEDGCAGLQRFVAGKDFGDFVVWRSDGVVSYQLAVVVDDAAMGITEVVRGADLLVSTARQILLYRALQLEVPKFYHCELVKDESGKRLAKRHDALSLRRLREQGFSPEELRRKMIKD